VPHSTLLEDTESVSWEISSTLLEDREAVSSAIPGSSRGHGRRLLVPPSTLLEDRVTVS
jgi:hypothetical protein